MKLHTLAIAAVAAVSAVAPANAAYYLLNYTATSGNPLPTSAHFYIQTSDTLNVSGGYDILAASGTFTANGATKHVSLAPVSPAGFSTDNIYFDADPVFTQFGLGLNFVGGTANLWGNGPATDYTFYTYVGGNYNVATDGSLTVAAATGVPEPGVWVLLVAGFGMVGVSARRRSNTVAA